MIASSVSNTSCSSHPDRETYITFVFHFHEHILVGIRNMGRRMKRLNLLILVLPLPSWNSLAALEQKFLREPPDQVFVILFCEKPCVYAIVRFDQGVVMIVIMGHDKKIALAMKVKYHIQKFLREQPDQVFVFVLIEKKLQVRYLYLFWNDKNKIRSSI